MGSTSLSGSQSISRFDDVLLRMRETGALQQLYDKWVKVKRGGGACAVSLGTFLLELMLLLRNEFRINTDLILIKGG